MCSSLQDAEPRGPHNPTDLLQGRQRLLAGALASCKVSLGQTKFLRLLNFSRHRNKLYLTARRKRNATLLKKSSLPHSIVKRDGSKEFIPVK